MTGVQTCALPILPNTVEKITSISFKCIPVSNNGQLGNELKIEEIPIDLFIVLDQSPQKVMKKPRTDILEIACEIAQGEQNPQKIKNLMTEGLYFYLPNKKGIIYTGDAHCIEIGSPTFTNNGNMEFCFKKVKDDKGGDCQDFSCLLQLCCNSLGIKMMICTIGRKSPTIDKVFKTHRIKCLGRNEYAKLDFNIHQTGYEITNYWGTTAVVYDPTCMFFAKPDFAKHLDREYYFGHLVDYPQAQVEWFRPKQVVKMMDSL